jgi:hypothetical protein
MAQKSELHANNWAPKRTELIATRNKEAVEEEIARLQGENPSKLYIALRQTALSNVLQNLSHAERLTLDAEVERIQREGNSEEDKRR